MSYINCGNGHLYDPAITPFCPECAAHGSHTVPLEGPAFPKTVPVNPSANVGGWADATPSMEAESYAPTQPVNYGKGGVYDQAIQPVAGWLVCVEGPEMGQDYRIHEQNNYIGRSEKMDICIAGDPTISGENHAIIAYSPNNKKFFFGPSSGASIIFHNGNEVINGTVQLQKGDKIQIGKCTFLFVPLCGEDFQWS